MGEIIIKKDNKHDKLQIPKQDSNSEGIKDKDKLKIELKSKSGKLHLNTYLNVTSNGQISITKYGTVEIDKHYELYPDDIVTCFYKKDDFEKNFTEYYEAFKLLALKHKKLEFGKSPRLSEGFTENLCRYLYGLYKIKGRTYDAVDSRGNNVEIKATTSKEGTVTINSDVEFDYLLWLYFNLDENVLEIYKIKYNFFKEKFKDNSGRITINLNEFATNNLDKKYDLKEDKIKEIN